MYYNHAALFVILLSRFCLSEEINVQNDFSDIIMNKYISAALSEDGKIFQDKCELKPVDMVFILDSSNSIFGDDWTRMISFVKTLVSSFTIGPDKTRVGLMIFTDYPQVVWTLHEYTDKTDLIRAFDKVYQQFGNTNSAEALRYMRRNMFSTEWGAREGVTKIGFFLTDGRSDNKRETLKEAMLLHLASTIQMITVGIGDSIDMDEIEAIATKPAGASSEKNWFLLTNWRELDMKLRKELSLRACDVQNEESSRTTWQTCSKRFPADVMFVLDPPSLGSTFLNNTVELFKALVNELPIAPDGFRAAYMPEGACSNEEVNSKITMHMTPNDAKEAVDKLGPQRTSLAGYLAAIRNQHFKINQNRRKVAVIAIDDYQDLSRVEFEARKLRIGRVRVVVLGIGSKHKLSELARIASHPDYVFQVKGQSDMLRLEGDLLRAICHRNI